MAEIGHVTLSLLTALTLVKMAAPMKVVMDDFRRCIIHFPGFEQETVETFTQTRWEKVRDCTQFWITISLDNPSAVSARICKGFLNTNYEDISSDVGYHPTSDVLQTVICTTIQEIEIIWSGFHGNCDTLSDLIILGSEEK